MDYNSMTFEIVDISGQNTIAAIYINSTGVVTINRRSVELLHNTLYAQYCINTEYKILAIKECKKDDFKAMKFFRKGSYSKGVVYNNRLMHGVVTSLIEDYDSKKRYMIAGEWDPERRIMYYNFNSAQIVDSFAYQQKVAFYEMTEEMLEEFDSIDRDIENGFVDISEDEEDEDDEQLYGTAYQQEEEKKVINYEPGKTWKPIAISIYVNDQYIDNSLETGCVIANEGDKIKLVSSKMVYWRGHTTIKIFDVDYSNKEIEFRVHKGEYGISYLSKNSYTEQGEREKGRINFYVY